MWSRVWVAHEVLAALRQVKICTPAVQSLRRGCGDPAACSAALCAGVMPCHFPASGGLTSRDSAREGHELCGFTKAGFEDAQPLGSKGGACRTSPEVCPLPAQVLRYCHTCPRAVEALINSYAHVRVSEDWADAVPAAVVQVRERAAAGAAAGARGG